jgi:flagellar biosynthetic protein FliQ
MSALTALVGAPHLLGMTDADVIDIATKTMMVTAKLGAPILITALLVGFLISLFQAATQIQEPTLSFVPKVIAIAAALLLSGNWMLSELIGFTEELFAMLPRLLGRG